MHRTLRKLPQPHQRAKTSGTWAFNPHQRSGGDARRQPQHAALLGAPVRLPRAAAHRRRPPAVRPRRDRGAARRLRGDAEHLVGGQRRPRARRRPGVAGAAAVRVRPLRRGRRRPPDRGVAHRALGRAHVEEVLLPSVEALAPAHNAPPSPEYGFAWRYATGWLAATQRDRAAGVARRGRPGLRRVAPAARPRRCTPRRWSSCCAARGLRTLTLTADSDPSRLGSRDLGAGPARGRAHRPRRVAGRAGPPGLRRPPRRRRGRRDPRLPRRDPRHGRPRRSRRCPTTPLAAREALLARLDARGAAGPLRARAVDRHRVLAPAAVRRSEPSDRGGMMPVAMTLIDPAIRSRTRARVADRAPRPASAAGWRPTWSARACRPPASRC